MIIDFHVHVFPPKIRDHIQYYFETEPFFRSLYESPRAHLSTAEDVVQSMDEGGIDRSVILNFGWSSQDLCRETNDYILEAASRFPGRLIPFFSVQPLSGPAAIEEIRRCARAGAKGIGELNPDGQGFDLDDAQVMPPLMKAVQDEGLVFQSHSSEPVGHLYRGKGQTTPDIVYRFIQLFPDVTMVFCHWGGGLPFYALMPEVSKCLERVYFDTAASPYLYRDQIYGQVAAIIGADKILFGTDYPLLKQGRFVERIRALGLSPEDTASILGGNAARLLGLVED
ncbi:MAG: amidohydrolase family protein [Dehalococcoidia bacterium]|nr:amidohydrolase family protein [Dehalococcoidia bacterium]